MLPCLQSAPIRSCPLRDCTIFIFRFALFAALHSLFAMPRIKSMISGHRRSEVRYYRLGYNVLSLALFAWVMAAYSNSPVLYYAPGIWSLVMYLLQLVLAITLYACIRQTGTADFLGIRKDPSPHLVTNGCYTVVRHPLYLFSILFLVLNPVMTAQWLILTILSTVYFICGAVVEERRLLRQFGTEYRRYQQQTPFIIPFRFRQPPSS